MRRCPVLVLSLHMWNFFIIWQKKSKYWYFGSHIYIYIHRENFVYIPLGILVHQISPLFFKNFKKSWYFNFNFTTPGVSNRFDFKSTVNLNISVIFWHLHHIFVINQFFSKMQCLTTVFIFFFKLWAFYHTNCCFFATLKKKPKKRVVEIKSTFLRFPDAGNWSSELQKSRYFRQNFLCGGNFHPPTDPPWTRSLPWTLTRPPKLFFFFKKVRQKNFKNFKFQKF